jgi:hypothetical protein
VNVPRLTRRPEEMSPRAQAYLLVLFLRHGSIAVACHLIPQTFTAPTYNGFKEALPLWGWSLLFAITSAVGLFSAIRRHEACARLALVLSAGSTGAIAGGFLTSALHNNWAGFIGLTLAIALLATDLIQVRGPQRSPFEPLVREALKRKG